ncbi:MAG TPA: AAA family ATPase [Coriobacteriia bacterium]|jgi:protein phosphatase
MEMRLLPDALVVLIGPAGCGKSTFAAAHFRRTQVVASDACRALVSDDEADAAASRDAFALMHLIVDMRLKRGRLTVADATNVLAEKRAELLAIARRRRRAAVAIVFALPEEVCQERNRVRGRVLPQQAIRAHMRDLRESLPHLGEEGFSAVWTLRSVEEAESAEVVVE